MKYTPLVVDSPSAATNALLKGKCRAVTADRSQLVAVRATASGGPQQLEIIPGTFSVEPIGPVVRRGDEDWFTLVRWVLYALIEAEELGVTRENVRTLLKDPGSFSLRDFLITSGQAGKSLGLKPDWVASVINAVGNYGEIYERHFGEKSSLKIERGHNKLWTQGGLMYAPQFQ
jgi:general L-amino acid transport system substrate-binding protein